MAPAPDGEPGGAPDAIVDAWPGARASRLTGWFERNGFTPVLTGLLVFILAFLLFQLVISPIVLGIGVVIQLVGSDAAEPPDMATLLEMMTTDGRLLLTANTVGQFLGFGLLAIVVARLHTPDWKPYLRLRRPDLGGLALAGLGWMAIYPAVLWTGQLNQKVPLPEWLRTLEEAQTEMLEGLLLGGDLSTPFIFFALAITPAICEELLFRGYLQRQTERTRGGVLRFVLWPWRQIARAADADGALGGMDRAEAWYLRKGGDTVLSIVGVGILFGLYHLRLSQAVPLSLLGIYMGFVVWATGSLWAGVLVHLLNNGFAVISTAILKQQPDFDPTVIEDLGVPWYVGLLGLVGAAVVGRAMQLRRHRRAGDAPDARPVVSSLSPVSAPLP